MPNSSRRLWAYGLSHKLSGLIKTLEVHFALKIFNINCNFFEINNITFRSTTDHKPLRACRDHDEGLNIDYKSALIEQVGYILNFWTILIYTFQILCTIVAFLFIHIIPNTLYMVYDFTNLNGLIISKFLNNIFFISLSCYIWIFTQSNTLFW